MEEVSCSSMVVGEILLVAVVTDSNKEEVEI